MANILRKDTYVFKSPSFRLNAIIAVLQQA